MFDPYKQGFYGVWRNLSSVWNEKLFHADLYCLYNFYLQIAPLMPTFRDLIFLAIDHNKQDIAFKLASLGADLNRKEKVCYQIMLTNHKSRQTFLSIKLQLFSYVSILTFVFVAQKEPFH